MCVCARVCELCVGELCWFNWFYRSSQISIQSHTDVAFNGLLLLKFVRVVPLPASAPFVDLVCNENGTSGGRW